MACSQQVAEVNDAHTVQHSPSQGTSTGLAFHQDPSSTSVPELCIFASDQLPTVHLLPSSYISFSITVPSSRPDPSLIWSCYTDTNVAGHREKVQ